MGSRVLKKWGRAGLKHAEKSASNPIIFVEPTDSAGLKP